MARHCVIGVAVFIEERLAQAILFLLLSYYFRLLSSRSRECLEFGDLEIA